MENRTQQDVKAVAYGVSNSSYKENFDAGGLATEQLMDLFDRIQDMPYTKQNLDTPKGYIDMYDNNFYTYQGWGALVESEKEQNDGLTEEECKEQIGKTIWQLACGWWVQYV